MKKSYSIISTAAFCVIIMVCLSALAEDIDEPQQSTTGPEPPAEVLARDAARQLMPEAEPGGAVQVVISGVPDYLWRHGCGPTAVGMVVGYYDSRGYSDLITGDASTQTAAVNQSIASGGDLYNPNPPGSEEHYEDYATPEDYYPTILADDYIGKRSPHIDNCIADYMDTSKSTRDNYYGWSWSSDVAPSFTDYVNQQNSSYGPTVTEYRWSNGTLTWNVLKGEIDSNRPMVFLVDTDGDNSTDHFVTVVGYNDGTPLKYGCYDTWSPQGVRWETFRGMATGAPWGISRGWSFQLAINAPASIDYPTSSATGEYTVSWSAVGGATSYQLERSDDSGNTWSEIYSGASTSYLENVGDGSYRYRVKATIASGSSDWTTGTWDCVVGATGCVSEYSSSDVPKAISDSTTVNSTIVISQTGLITDINVKLNITHTYDSDLDVFLIAPDATRVELFTDVGAGGDNFSNTITDDEAATAITAGTAPFAGTYRPEGSLAALDGKNFSGTWTLEITDDAGGDTGTLNSWSLIIETSCNIADFNEDGDVDTDDLDTLCTSWLTGDTVTDIAPAEPDGIVNMMDFAVFAENWLEGI